MKSFFCFAREVPPHIFGRCRHTGLIMVEVPPCKDIDEDRIKCNVSNQSGLEHEINRQLLHSATFASTSSVCMHKTAVLFAHEALYLLALYYQAVTLIAFCLS